MHSFRTLNYAIKLHQQCLKLKLPVYLRSQILRSSSSVALNLSEGRARHTTKDQVRLFYIALGSLRETMTALTLANYQNHPIYQLADVTGAHLYKLIKNAR